MPILSSLISSMLSEKPQSQATTPAQTQIPQSTPPPPSPQIPQPTTSQLPAQRQSQIPPQTQLTPFQRSLKQLSLYFFGATFMAASVAITRRAVIRRQRESFPRFFSASNNPGYMDSNDRSLLAVHAFGLATLNVASFGVLMTGGLAWGFDLCSMGELKERTQAALMRQSGGGVLNPDDEKELEKMMGDLMKRLGMDVSEEEVKNEVKK